MTAIAGTAAINPSAAYSTRVTALCSLVVFVEGFNTQSVGYVAPELARAWRFSAGDMGLFIVLGLVGSMLGAAVIAPIADRLGRRPLLLACVSSLGICALITAINSSSVVLDPFRLLTGLAIGGALPNAIALTSEYSPQRRRSTLVAIMYSGFTVGALTSGLVAAWLVPALGGQSVFYAGSGLAILLTPVLFISLPESPRFLTSKRDDALHTSGGKMFVLFRDGRAHTTVLIWVIFFTALVDVFLITSWLTTTLSNLGVPTRDAIMVTVAFQIGGVFGISLGWLADRTSPGAVLPWAYLIGGISTAGIGLVGANVPLLTLSAFAAGVGLLGGQTVANSTVAIAYPSEIRATGVGWAIGVGRVGSIVGPSITALFISMKVESQSIFLLAAIPALCAAGAALFLARNAVFTIRSDLPA